MKLSRRSFFSGLSALALTKALPPVEKLGVVEEVSFPTSEYLVRSELWSRQLKELLLNDLMSMKFVEEKGKDDA